MFIFSLTGFADGIGWEQGRMSPQYLETFSWCLRWFFLALSCVSYSIWGMDTLSQVKTLLTVLNEGCNFENIALNLSVSFKTQYSKVFHTPIYLDFDILCMIQISCCISVRNSTCCASWVSVLYNCLHPKVCHNVLKLMLISLILLYQTHQLREIYKKSCSSWSLRSPSWRSSQRWEEQWGLYWQRSWPISKHSRSWAWVNIYPWVYVGFS